MKVRLVLSRLFVVALGASTLMTAQAQLAVAAATGPVQRVLLISVDGLHASDLSAYITAKHGQSAIDPAQRRIISSKVIPGIVEGVQKGLLAQATQDDVSLLWLTDATRTMDVVTALRANADKAGIADITYGDSLKAQFGDPTIDSRVPDIIVHPQIGVIYTNPKATKLAEHGGFSQNDTNVALLVANPGLKTGVNNAVVHTTQIAPTILQSLGMDPNWLQAVKLEKTTPLPGLTMK